MGRYAAHQVAALPLPIKQAIEHADAVLTSDAAFTRDELADAAALLERPIESPQRALVLTPHPLMQSESAARDLKNGCRFQGTPGTHETRVNKPRFCRS
jgi:hypothetical protein